MKGFSLFGTGHSIIIDLIAGLIFLIAGIIMIIKPKKIDDGSLQGILFENKETNYIPSKFDKMFSLFGKIIFVLVGGFLIIKSILRYYGIY